MHEQIVLAGARSAVYPCGLVTVMILSLEKPANLLIHG